MKKTAPKFTPNVVKGDFDGPRYVLYKHGGGLFSITPNGTRFRASWERDACGLGCACGAVLTSVSRTGKHILARAEQIDRMSQTVQERRDGDKQV